MFPVRHYTRALTSSVALAALTLFSGAALAQLKAQDIAGVSALTMTGEVLTIVRLARPAFTGRRRLDSPPASLILLRQPFTSSHCINGKVVGKLLLATEVLQLSSGVRSARSVRH